MGANQSVETLGHHVLSSNILDLYFDYITHINSVYIGTESIRLTETIGNSVGKSISLTVYSSKTMESRVVHLPIHGPLGIQTRLCSYAGSESLVWKILQVYPDSPSSKAGLTAKDFILGSPTAHLYQKEDLYSLVESCVGRALKLWVYNLDSDAIREVWIVPRDDWGGQGLLGCDIGFGYQYRIQLALLKESVSRKASVVSPTVDSPLELSSAIQSPSIQMESIESNPIHSPSIQMEHIVPIDPVDPLRVDPKIQRVSKSVSPTRGRTMVTNASLFQEPVPWIQVRVKGLKSKPCHLGQHLLQ